MSVFRGGGGGGGDQFVSPLARLSCAAWVLPDVHHGLLGGGWSHGKTPLWL